MVTFAALPATRVATAELNHGSMSGTIPSRGGTAEGSVDGMGGGRRKGIRRSGSVGNSVGGTSMGGSVVHERRPATEGNATTAAAVGFVAAGTSSLSPLPPSTSPGHRRSSSPAMEDLMERAASSPSTEELVHRLTQPAMISGSDMPLTRLTLSGGESLADMARPVSESLDHRNQQERLKALMAGKKVSKDRRHSVVAGKGQELVKPQGFRRVATAVPMSPIGKSRERMVVVVAAAQEAEDDGGVAEKERMERKERKRRAKPQQNYAGYSTR